MRIESFLEYGVCVSISADALISICADLFLTLLVYAINVFCERDK